MAQAAYRYNNHNSNRSGERYASPYSYAPDNTYASPYASPYVSTYGNTVRAAQPDPAWSKPVRAPYLRELEGTTPRPAAPPRLRQHRRLFVTMAIVCAIFIVTGIGCAYLSNATSLAMMSNNTLQQSIAQAESVGNSQAAQYAAIVNPDNIQREATALGMAVDPNPQVLQVGAGQ